MSTSRYFDRICAIVLVVAMIVTILFMNGQSLGLELVVDADSEAHSDSEYFTENDQTADWDASSATYITLDGDDISISGGNAYAYEGGVVISGSGKFVITGTLDDGYISVDANANSKVWILLNGVDISCSDHACLRVEEADKVFLTLAEGTINTLTGGEELSEEALEDGAFGVIFAHDDLTINGSGSLQINAGYKHGIKANDDLVITGGSITIDAAADGIHVNDSFRLKEASVSITAGDDGILTENEESYFYQESGEIAIQADGDGIHSGGDVIVAGGSITMDAGDDGIHADGGIEIEDGVIEMNSCYEGIEGATITVSGGDITIYPTDDGFNASSGSASGEMFGSMAGNGGGGHGNMAPAETGMQPPEDAEFSSENGMQPPTRSEMPSGDQLDKELTEYPEGGLISEQETDNGEEQKEQKEQKEQQETQDGTDNYIRISGGTITIINENGNDADGLDSNGDIVITGGDIRISLTNSGTNCAIDAATENGGIAEISGGTVIACGSSSMAEAFDSSSTQCSLMYIISSGMDEGTCLTVEDEEGTVILSWTVPCSFSSAVISCPAMQIGETYIVAADDSEETITLSEVSAAFGDAQNTMFGSNMNWGGMKTRERRGETPDFSGGPQPEQAESEQGVSGQVPGDTLPVVESDAGETDHAAAEQESNAQGFTQRRQGPAGMGSNPADERNGERTSETDEEPDEETGYEAESTSVLSYDADILIMTMLSFLILGLGLFIAKRYKRAAH